MAREITRRGTAEGAHFHAGAHATFIVDLACAIAFNTQERDAVDRREQRSHRQLR